MASRRRRAALCRCLAPLWLGALCATPAWAQLAPGDALNRITAQDIAESLISLANFTTTPGVEGTIYNVDFGDGQPKVRYDKVNIWIPKAWATSNPKISVFTPIGYAGIWVDDPYNSTNLSGQPVSIQSDRSINSGRFGLGVDFWPTPRWRISPYLAVAISGLRSQTSTRGGSIGNVPPQLAALLSDWDANAWSLAGILEVKYQRWFGVERHRLELEARYAGSWTDTFNESLPVLDTSAWRNSLVVEAMWRTITDYRLFGRRIGFNAFVNNASFPGQERDDLGFNWYFGLGGGIDVFLKQRIGKFARLDFVGLRGTGVLGSDVRGGGIALTFKPHRGPF